MNDSSHYNWSINSNCGDVNYLSSSTLQCNFTKTVSECINDDGFVNYIQLTYCTIESKSLSTILLLFVLLILFFAIGTNADDFLCPVLISISKSLKLSDNIAGVTFLAFGNGAPDIFSSIVGITNENPNLIIGQLYGAGIFVTTIVVGSILMQKRFEIMKRPLMRDITFYLVTTTLVWSTFFTKKILLFHSIIFIIIYLIYVIVVIVSGYIYKRQQNRIDLKVNNQAIHNGSMPRENLNRQTKYVVNEKEKFGPIKSITNKNYNDSYEGVVLRRIKHRQYCQNPVQQRRLTLYHIHSDPGRRISQINSNNNNSSETNTNVYSITLNVAGNKQNNDNINDNRNNDIDDLNNNVPFKSIEEWMEAKNFDRRFTISDTNFIQTIKNNDNPEKFQFSFRKIFIEPVTNLCNDNRQYNNGSNNIETQTTLDSNQNDTKLFIKIIEASRFDLKLFRDLYIFGKISMIIKAPIYLIYTITIPVVDNDLPMRGWTRTLNLAHLIISPQICLLIIQSKFMDGYQLHLIVLVVSLIVFLLVWCTSQANHPPPYHIVFAYFGFLISISWIYAIANEVVNILDAIRVIFNLSKFMIGLTIGAWGNSIGDFLSNLSMAKNGFPRMAISACFGGPVLNMLLGIGIPYTILFIKQQTYEIGIEYNTMITVLFGTITISLLTTIFTLVFVTRFQSNRIHAMSLYSIYICFIIAAIVTEMKLI